MSAGILDRIVAARRRRYGVTGEGGSGPPPGVGAPLAAATNAFLAALEAARPRALIAEVKLASPRLGTIPCRRSPERQAEAYARGGAAALSVVVEPEFFGGSWELLARCAGASGLPTLAKDFVVHPRQLDEAREAGASAMLLVAALHGASELAAWAAAARARGLAPLVETHEAADVARLEGGAWEMVGVNQRDLRTFEVDRGRGSALAPFLPAAALRIAESGIASAADVERLAAEGFEAFLVGESLLLAEDPVALLRELRG